MNKIEAPNYIKSLCHGELAVSNDGTKYVFYSDELDLWIEFMKDKCNFIGTTDEIACYIGTDDRRT